MNVFAALQVWEIALEDLADLLVDFRSEDVLVLHVKSLKGEAGAVVAAAVSTKPHHILEA